MGVRQPGPCLFPDTPRCGKVSSYSNLGCRSDACLAAKNDKARGATSISDQAVLLGRPAVRGLRVIDACSDHPARGRWAQLIAKIGDVA